jgi:hypothetical protein
LGKTEGTIEFEMKKMKEEEREESRKENEKKREIMKNILCNTLLSEWKMISYNGASARAKHSSSPKHTLPLKRTYISNNVISFICLIMASLSRTTKNAYLNYTLWVSIFLLFSFRSSPQKICRIFVINEDLFEQNQKKKYDGVVRCLFFRQ